MKNDDLKINILSEDVEYIIIQNENTGEEIAKITQYDIEVVEPYIIKLKDIEPYTDELKEKEI